MTCDISLESSQWGYNFASDLISIGGLHTKLWGSRVVGVLTLGILGLPFGSPGTKCHLGVGLMEKHKVYYKGKVVASPKSRPWWILWIWICSWLVLAPKVFQLCTNQLVWLCRSMWMIEVLVNLPSPTPELQHAPLPSKCCEPRNMPQLLTLMLFSS